MAYVAVDSPLFEGRSFFRSRRRFRRDLLSPLQRRMAADAGRLVVDFVALAALLSTLYAVVAMAGILMTP